MASTSSSTKKAAKLAQKGKGQKVRFQGGTIFPLAVAITLIAGLALIVYARQTVPSADDSPPTVNDHWHGAYGFYLCDGWVQFNGNLEERNSQGQFTNVNFARSGIHSHDDGVMHWHPYTSRATGKNATMSVLFDSYETEVTNDSIKFPSPGAVSPNPNHLDQGPSQILEEYIEGETQCDGEDAEVTLKAWSSFTDSPGDGKRYIANVDQVHLDNDGMVFAVYFTARGADQEMPPWAQELPALGAVDQQQLRPEDLESLLQSDTDTSVVVGEDGTISGSIPTSDVPSSEAPTTDVPSTDAPATTTGG